MALADLGIGRVPIYLVEQYIKSGELKVLFEEFQTGDFALNAIYPPSRHLTSRIRALIDHLVAHFAEKDYGWQNLDWHQAIITKLALSFFNLW